MEVCILHSCHSQTFLFSTFTAICLSSLPLHRQPGHFSLPPIPTSNHGAAPSRRLTAGQPLPVFSTAQRRICPFCEMPEESEIGLSWAPKVPLPLHGGKDTTPKLNMQESLWKPKSELVDGLFVPPTDPRKVNKLARKNVKDTTGKSWFDMPAPTMTPELKKELEILQLRNVMDPKRHFKRGGKSKALPKYFQVGTVIEPPSEFYSSRRTKKERKTTLADELLSDQALKSYRKRKVKEIEESRRPGGNEKWKNKGKKTFKRAKQRRG